MFDEDSFSRPVFQRHRQRFGEGRRGGVGIAAGIGTDYAVRLQLRIFFACYCCLPLWLASGPVGAGMGGGVVWG